ncbi:hypothetical protein BLA39750_01061 [Burkholderia lata]|uniref:Uncharacterized protein n=1 Tax=Burkholderia lata (strain ATCC 17760 / DSM 23089 / LMG 22485 / NCIMB 9086 / R18194 / 383) TaxID=482957 RepID=A0A6P2UPT0_BURL3|nr:hypothetical protein BLA39750_01061 [Burkholderia lata]
MLTQTIPPALVAEIATLVLGIMMLLRPTPAPEFATVAIRATNLETPR